MDEYFTEAQRGDLQYFQDTLNGFLKNPLYRHKFAIVSGKKVVGIFDTFANAVVEAAFRFPQGGYVIQQIIGGDEFINFLYPALA